MGPFSIAGAIGAAGVATRIATSDKIRSSEDQHEDFSVVEGLLIGAAALATPYLLGAGALKGSKALGKTLYKNREAIVNGATKTVELGAKAALPIGYGAANAVVAPAAGAVKVFSDLFLRTAKEGSTHSNLLGVEISKFGKGALMATGLAAGVKGGYDKYTESRMGQLTGAETSTPEITIDNVKRDMAEAYGAGGDLVFALNQNRRG